MRSWFWILLLGTSVGLWAQSSPPGSSAQASGQAASGHDSSGQGSSGQKASSSSSAPGSPGSSSQGSSSQGSSSPAASSGSTSGAGTGSADSSAASQPNPAQTDSQTTNSLPSAPTPQFTPSDNPPAPSPAPGPVPENPGLTPPRSGHVDASALGDDAGESSSKDHPVDLSPPKGDDKHAGNDDVGLTDEGSGDLPPWDPHKAMKDIEVGDFYFKQGDYIGAESRYREALYYKTNDAIATYRLGVCLEKMHRADEAREEYEAYLRILPDGPEAKHARKALDRLKDEAGK